MYTLFGSGEEQSWNKSGGDGEAHEQQPLQTNPKDYNSTEKGTEEEKR